MLQDWTCDTWKTAAWRSLRPPRLRPCHDGGAIQFGHVQPQERSGAALQFLRVVLQCRIGFERLAFELLIEPTACGLTDSLESYRADLVIPPMRAALRTAALPVPDPLPFFKSKTPFLFLGLLLLGRGESHGVAGAAIRLSAEGTAFPLTCQIKGCGRVLGPTATPLEIGTG